MRLSGTEMDANSLFLIVSHVARRKINALASVIIVFFRIGPLFMSKFLLALLIAVFCWPVQALMLSPQMGLHEPASLSGQLSALRDAKGQWQIDEVTAPGKATEFVALEKFLSRGYTTDVYWLRFTLQRPAHVSDEWMLEVAPPYLNDVTLFVPRSGGGFTSTSLGDMQAYSHRPVPHRSFVFPLHLLDDQPLTLYLRVQTRSTMLVQVRVWQYSGLLAQVQESTGLYSVYFGILTLALINNLMFWFRLRERVYLFYCAYLAALTLTAMATGGFLTQLLFTDQPLWGNRAVGVSIALVYLLGTLFFIRLLRFRENFPRIKRVFDAVLLFYALCLMAALAGRYGAIAPWMFLFTLATNSAVVFITIFLLWRGQRQYLFYSLAFAVNFAAVPLSIAIVMGWLMLPVSADIVTIAGSLIHIVLLNFALVDRLWQTEKKMLSALRQSAKLEAQRDAVEQQRKFVAMVSHEFRTPLAVIDATAQSLEIACSQSNTLSYEFIAPRQEKIRRAVRRLVSLLDNFLTQEWLDYHDSQTKGETLDLRELASDAAKTWAHLLPSPDQLQLELGGQIVPVWADRVMMTLALSNLIDNALKYAPTGSPITLRVGKTQGDGWIEVQDQGIGLSADEITHVFEKFYRGGDAQKTPGAGLGLYLVRSIARDQGGEVEVESTPCKGSRFRLCLALLPQ